MYTFACEQVSNSNTATLKRYSKMVVIRLIEHKVNVFLKWSIIKIKISQLLRYYSFVQQNNLWQIVTKRISY